VRQHEDYDEVDIRGWFGGPHDFSVFSWFGENPLATQALPASDDAPFGGVRRIDFFDEARGIACGGGNVGTGGTPGRSAGSRTTAASTGSRRASAADRGRFTMRF
jgi:hypothetical protein